MAVLLKAVVWALKLISTTNFALLCGLYRTSTESLDTGAVSDGAAAKRAWVEEQHSSATGACFRYHVLRI